MTLDLDVALLDAAVARTDGALELHYQPEVDLQTGAIVAMEALLRLHLVDVGLVAAADVVPAVERVGRLGRVGDWVLETAAVEAARWRALRGPARQLRINVDTGQLRDPGFADRVAGAVARHGLPPGTLGLEVSEASLRELGEDALPVLQDLRACGVALAVDDTTFYATLAVIETLPVDVVKLGHRWVRGIEDGDVTNLTVLLSRAHDKGLLVVAEGVESWGEAARLVELGCDRAHGWLYASPQRADKARWLLTQGIGWRGEVVEPSLPAQRGALRPVLA